LKKWKWFVISGVVIAFGYGLNQANALISAGSGFSAKNICSGYFISGIPGERIRDEALVPAAAVFSNVEFIIDETERRVDASLFGLHQRRAIYRDGVGCTLLPSDTEQLAREVRVADFNVRSGDHFPVPSPATVPGDKRLEGILDAAFSEPDPERMRNTKAVVVLHRGRLVAEKYADGVGPGTPLIGWSMAKSVTNLLLGILVRDGTLSLDQKAPVPQWQLDDDDQRASITIDQLLRMSSGLEFNEVYAMYSDVTRMLAAEADAAAFAASKPLLNPPGSHWEYSSGTSNILSGIIRRTVGGSFQDYYEFPQKRLFGPLGIRTAVLETDHSGNFIGSSFMYASARDWARLGQFCLQEGHWNGKQLLPDDWIEYSTTPTPNNPERNYGAHFWLNADPEQAELGKTWPSLPPDTYSMNGFQGQRVIIVPSKDLVVVRMGFSAGPNRGIETLVADIIAYLDT
jgi:CubicO group peptidase (beta-lactamase class C family)